MRGFLPFYRAVSLSAAGVAGALAALALGGADQFGGFKNPSVSFVSSHKIGFTAGLSSPDDTGRRYLIGVAAAAQSGVFAVWIGIAFVLGFPTRQPRWRVSPPCFSISSPLESPRVSRMRWSASGAHPPAVRNGLTFLSSRRALG